jgi:E3 ubiquitin-protein ligase DOA10
MVKLQVLGNNSKTVNNIKNLTWDKNDQHNKIYLPCNFEVNLITHLGVIALFSSNLGRKVLKFGKFDENREITPKWVMGFTSKLQSG